MITINTVSASKFSFNGIYYFKNFTPFVTGNKISILNTYDACISLTSAPTHFSEYIVNGVTYTTVAALQDALLPVLFTKEEGGSAGSGEWGDITGDIDNQLDLKDKLDAKENTITAGTTSQYFRGDKTWQTLDKTAVGLSNVDNTSDANKPVSIATQTALNAKANDDAVVKLTGIQIISGDKIFNNGATIETDVFLNQTGGIGFKTGYTSISGDSNSFLFGVSVEKTARFLLSSLSQLRNYTLPNTDGTLALKSDIPTNPITGSLTSGYLPKATGTTTLGNSLIYDNGTNVGIGTTSPLALLDINGKSVFGNGSVSSPSISFRNSTNSGLYLTDDGFGALINVGIGATNIATFKYNGNVGIGTTSPSAKLSLYDTSDVYLNISRSTSFVNIGVDSTGTFYNTNSNHRFLYNSGSNEAMRITSSGNVGIGTTSPNSTLDVNGISYFRSDLRFGSNFAGTNTGILKWIASTNRLGIFTWGDSRDIQIGGNNVIFAAEDATERMRITSSGHLLVGTTTSLYGNSTRGNIELNGSASSLLALKINDVIGCYLYTSNVNSELYSTLPLTFAVNGSERMRITSNGDVCVGTTAANSRFNVTSPFGNTVTFDNTSGFSNASFLVFQASGNAIGSIARVGTTNAVSYNTTSDYRLKEDLNKVKGLELISKIKVYDFKWKNHTDRMDGVIAHELQEVVPYAVTGEKDAEQMQSVDYSKLVPILVQAIQDQQKQIDELKTLINK